MIATQCGNTAHNAKQPQIAFEKGEKFVRGFSQALHHDNITVTYWNDNNVVTFLDNTVYHQDESIGIPWRLIKEQIENSCAQGSRAIQRNLWLG